MANVIMTSDSNKITVEYNDTVVLSGFNEATINRSAITSVSIKEDSGVVELWLDNDEVYNFSYDNLTIPIVDSLDGITIVDLQDLYDKLRTLAMWNTEPLNSVPIGNSIYQFLDENGDGTGNKDAVGDYASDTSFYITPQSPNEIYEITRVIINIADNGSMDAGSYGNNIDLNGSEGLKVQVLDENDAVLKDLTDNILVQTNGHWARYSYDVSITDFGSGENYVNVRWSFDRSGKSIRLSYGEKFAIKLNGDFENLNKHYFMVQGEKYNIY